MNSHSFAAPLSTVVARRLLRLSVQGFKELKEFKKFIWFGGSAYRLTAFGLLSRFRMSTAKDFTELIAWQRRILSGVPIGHEAQR